MHSGSLFTRCRGQRAAVSGAGPRRARTDELPRQQEAFEMWSRFWDETGAALGTPRPLTPVRWPRRFVL